jgi:hypothetical protein
MTIPEQIAEAKKQLMDAEIDCLNMRKIAESAEDDYIFQKRKVNGLKATLLTLETLNAINDAKYLPQTNP